MKHEPTLVTHQSTGRKEPLTTHGVQAGFIYLNDTHILDIDENTWTVPRVPRNSLRSLFVDLSRHCWHCQSRRSELLWRGMGRMPSLLTSQGDVEVLHPFRNLAEIRDILVLKIQIPSFRRA